MSASGDNGDEGEFATGLKEMSESPSVLTFRKATMLTASYFPTFDQRSEIITDKWGGVESDVLSIIQRDFT